LPAERSTGSRRPFVVVIVGLLVAAALVRIVLIARMGPHYYFADTAEYEAAARSILAGHGPGRDFPRAPLYPAFMALGFALFGEGNYAGVRMLQLLAGLAVVALCMRLGHRLACRRGAVFAGAGAAFAPTLVFTTGMLYPTALYTLLLLAVTLVAYGLDARPSRWRGALLGLLMFLLWMTDQVALAPLAAVLLWLLWGAWTKSPAASEPRRRAGAVAIAVATAVLLATPWTIIHKRLYGHSAFFMAKAQVVLYFARTDPNVAGPRAVRDTTTVFRPLTTVQFVGREWRLLREQPVPYVSDYVLEFVHFFQPMPDRITTRNVYTSSGAKLVTALYFLPVLIFGIVGLLFGGGHARDRLLLALVPIATAALYALFFTQTRYRIPTEPQLLALAALGLVRLFPRLSATNAGAPPAEPAAGAAPE
jgi:hypothetical protein